MSRPLRGWRKVAVSSWAAPNDPTTYGVLELDAAAALEYLDRLRQLTGTRVTMLSLVIKALGHALAQEPAAMTRLRFGRLVDRPTLDVFAQVDRGKGLDLSGVKLTRVPERSIVELARELEARALSVRRDRSDEILRRSVGTTDRIPTWLLPLALKIQDVLANDLQWAIPAMGIFPDPFGSAMVTNIGSLGLDLALPPIPTICRCLLVVAMGQIQQRPWVVDGQVVTRPILKLGISLDHRYVDGAHGARLARTFSQALLDPVATFGLPEPAETEPLP